MEQIYTHQCGANEFISPTLIDFLAKYTSLLGKEISIYLSRAGRVLDVSIGDSDHVSLPIQPPSQSQKRPGSKQQRQLKNFAK